MDFIRSNLTNVKSYHRLKIYNSLKLSTKIVLSAVIPHKKYYIEHNVAVLYPGCVYSMHENK